MSKAYLNKVISLFFVLGFLFIPITIFGLTYQYRLTEFFFLKPVTFVQDHFFANALKNIDFSSDTIGLNILLGLLFILAFILIGLSEFFKTNSSKTTALFKALSTYYIAAVLLRYGFDKTFKQQFYLPEPNILYSSFGSLTKDTLFWSTIGLSHTYSIVSGTVEVLTAMLILIRRTRIFGYCLAIGVLLNILLINFSFDISVKTFTTFLLAIIIFNVYPYLKSIYAFFVQNKQIQLVNVPTPKSNLNKYISMGLSIGVICFTLFPYLQTGSFNDDNAPRPFLHGGYQIEHFKIGNDTLGKSDFPYKRFFIHRNNYIIFQQQDDKMIDYYFEMNIVKRQLTLHDYQGNTIILIYNYDEKTATLQLSFDNKQKWIIQSTSLNLGALPALRDNFHYTIDEIK
jgi:hypothetical protein